MVKCTKCNKELKNERGLELHMTLAHSAEGKARLKRQTRSRRRNAKANAHPELVRLQDHAPQAQSFSAHRQNSGLQLLTKSTCLMLIADSIERMDQQAMGRLTRYIHQLTDEQPSPAPKLTKDRNGEMVMREPLSARHMDEMGLVPV